MRGKKETPSERDNPRAIAKYLNEALSTGDAALITKAIGEMVRAQGMTRFSQKARLRRDKSSAAFDRVIQVLQALDMQLMVKRKR